MIEIDENTLRNILGIKQGGPLPEKLVETYDKFKLGYDRLGGGSVQPQMLVMLTLLAGTAPAVVQPVVREAAKLPGAFDQELDPIEEEAEEVVEKVVEKTTDWSLVPPGVQVYVNVGGVSHSGVFVEPCDGGLQVQVEDELMVASEDKVRLAE